jgi:arylsulfatase A-like enzyme
LGGPNTFPHFAAGWAVAGDAPFTGTKQVASNFGGTRNPRVVHWPKRIKAKGEVRAQFHHVIDVARPSSRRPACPSPRW